MKTYAVMWENDSKNMKTGLTEKQVKAHIRRFEMWKKSHFDEEIEGNYTTRLGNRVTIIEEVK